MIFNWLGNIEDSENGIIPFKPSSIPQGGADQIANFYSRKRGCNYDYIQFSVNSESHINRSESVQLFESVQRGQWVCSEF